MLFWRHLKSHIKEISKNKKSVNEKYGKEIISEFENNKDETYREYIIFHYTCKLREIELSRELSMGLFEDFDSRKEEMFTVFWGGLRDYVESLKY